jgi:hypothetical protein
MIMFVDHTYIRTLYICISFIGNNTRVEKKKISKSSVTIEQGDNPYEAFL